VASKLLFDDGTVRRVDLNFNQRKNRHSRVISKLHAAIIEKLQPMRRERESAWLAVARNKAGGRIPVILTLQFFPQ
jgi:hypothetical protein